MKQLFNWLAKKSKFQPTLGYAAMRPFLGDDSKWEKNPLYNLFNFGNGGRIVERACFLSGCFLAAASLPLAAPVAAATIAGGGAILLGAKAVGVLAGKVTDFLVEDMNSRVIPRREEAAAAKKAQQPPKPPQP